MIYVTEQHQQAWEDAVQRAKDERVRVWKASDGWRAHSKDSKNIYSLMAMQDPEDKKSEVKIICSCTGFGHRGVCKHSARLAMRLSNKGFTVRLS